MPRYYIDSDDNDQQVIDEAGFELSGPLEARTLALDVLPDMAREKLPDGDRRTFSVRVRDESGTVLYSAELAMAGAWHVPPPEEASNETSSGRSLAGENLAGGRATGETC